MTLCESPGPQLFHIFLVHKCIKGWEQGWFGSSVQISHQIWQLSTWMEGERTKNQEAKMQMSSPQTAHPYYHYYCFFWLSFVACTVLVLQPGIEPVSPTVEIWSPNHWTAREFPAHPYFWVIERRKWERPKIREFLSLRVSPFEAVMAVGRVGGGGVQLPQTPHSEVPSVLHTLPASSTLNLFIPDGFFSFSSSVLRAVPVLTVSKHQINP